MQKWHCIPVLAKNWDKLFLARRDQVLSFPQVASFLDMLCCNFDLLLLFPRRASFFLIMLKYVHDVLRKSSAEEKNSSSSTEQEPSMRHSN